MKQPKFQLLDQSPFYTDKSENFKKAHSSKLNETKQSIEPPSRKNRFHAVNF